MMLDKYSEIDKTLSIKDIVKPVLGWVLTIAAGIVAIFVIVGLFTAAGV